MLVQKIAGWKLYVVVESAGWPDSVLDWLRAEEPVLSALAAITVLLGVVIGGWRLSRRVLVPRALPREVRRRQLFADHVESQLRRLDEKEEWRDYRFARLEAEVETEGRRRGILLRRAGGREEGLRREKSLLDALKRSRERLIVLQGDPGSGKSVSLRKVAKDLAQEAMHSSRKDQTIPLYINLKELRPASRPVDAAAIREFVLASVNQANSRDVDRFLEVEFDRGMAEGTWLFLFDSFDEIPDVLSADEVDETVEEYADALFDFLHAMNTSRGVIASREFRGPYGFGWPRFTVQHLTAAQKRELIEKADLPPAAEQAVINGVASAEPYVARLTENPMLLGLLCEHVRETGEFPNSSHTVFETFVVSRLRRDADRVQQRFGIGADALRAIAEEIAFHLTADESLGLNPSRSQLSVALAAGGHGTAGLDRQLDALEYVKLARAPEDVGVGDDRAFTFAHRRFQEYFATCVVIRQPQRVSADTLLLDGRWRETAVTMLQTQPVDAVTGLVAEAKHRLLAGVARLSKDRSAGFFPWPPGSRHLLSLLDTGTVNRPSLVPEELREGLGELLWRAWDEGRRVDRKWVVEASSLADPPTATRIIEGVFATNSTLLHQAAYQQAGQFSELPVSLAAHIRLILVSQGLRGRMLRDWSTITAQVRRLANPVPWLHTAQLLRWTPVVDMLVVMPVLVLTAAVFTSAIGETSLDLWILAPLLLGDAAVFLSYALMPLLAKARDNARIEWAEAAIRADDLTPYLFILVASRGALVVPLLIGAGIDAWHAIEAGAGGLRTLPLFVMIVAAGVYAGVWPLAVAGAALSGAAASPARWPWLPMTTVPQLWHQLRLGRGQGRRSLAYWLSTIPATLVMPVASIWWDLETQLDRWRLRRQTYERPLIADQLQNLLRKLRHPRGVNELVSSVRRQDVSCTPDGIAFLEELAAQAEIHATVTTNRESAFPRFSRPDWLRSPETLPQRALDQIALITEERLRAQSTALNETRQA